MIIEFKPLPPNWSYLLSRKTVKQLIADLEIDCRLVEYMGTSRKPAKITSGLYSAGSLDARGTETGWCFRLQMWGLPDLVIGDRQAEFSIIIREDIQTFVSDRQQEVIATNYPPLDRRFFFRVEDDRLVPSFSTWKIAGIEDMWANRSPWWI